MSQSNPSNGDAFKAMGMLSQLLEIVQGVDIESMSYDDLFALMAQSKEIERAFAQFYKVGRAFIKPIVEANGGSLVTKNGEYKITLGYARLSAPLFDDALVKEGLSLKRIKELRKECKGNRPEQLELIPNDTATVGS